MLLRLVPNERFCLVFPKQLDLERSILGYLQPIEYNPPEPEIGQYKYYFKNTGTESYTVKFVFNDKSELIVPVYVYNEPWLLSSPFDLEISSFKTYVDTSLSPILYYDGLYLQYNAQGGYLLFENINTFVYRLICRGQNCALELLDCNNNSLFVTPLTDLSEKYVLTLEPSDKAVATVNGTFMFRTMRTERSHYYGDSNDNTHR